MKTKSFIFIIAIMFAPFKVSAEQVKGQMGAEIINLQMMSKQELIWFCATSRHVQVCQDLKSKIKERRKALKERQKNIKQAQNNDDYVSNEQKRLQRREQKIRRFLNAVGY